VAVQPVGEAGAADAAVALAHHEDGAEPAVLGGEIGADELADGGDVTVDAPETGTELGLLGAAVAGADGVDEDEVGLGEEAVVVRDQLVRGRGHEALFAAHLGAFGPGES
jgi:hypothetical protein